MGGVHRCTVLPCYGLSVPCIAMSISCKNENRATNFVLPNLRTTLQYSCLPVCRRRLREKRTPREILSYKLKEKLPLTRLSLLPQSLRFVIQVISKMSAAAAVASAIRPIVICGTYLTHLSKFHQISRPLSSLSSPAGPSGTGKSTLLKKLFTEYPDKFAFSISRSFSSSSLLSQNLH